jgi:glycine cleavage system H protein
MTLNNYEVPDNLLFDKENYWVRITEGSVQVGLSDYGQRAIGDVLYLEIGEEGQKLQQGENFGSIEAGKWVGSLRAPISGTILVIHKELLANPSPINKNPYQTGWLYETDVADATQLKGMMNAKQYTTWVEEQILLEEQECQQHE